MTVHDSVSMYAALASASMIAANIVGYCWNVCSVSSVQCAQCLQPLRPPHLMVLFSWRRKTYSGIFNREEFVSTSVDFPATLT